MKKPDAITVIQYNKFKKTIYPLPVSTLLYVGKSTEKILEKRGIYTIGDLAHYDKDKLVKLLGKHGITLYNYANGIDNEPVSYYSDKRIPKSISKGLTFIKDTSNIFELENMIKILSDDVSYSLRRYNLKCSIVSINIKDSNFISITRQRKINNTNLFQDISKIAIEIFKENYIESKEIRALTVSVSNLIDANNELQLDLFSLDNKKNKIEDVTKVVDNIRIKYGRNKVMFGKVMTNL